MFRVFDRERNENVALKLLHAPSATTLRGLRHELALMQGVSHPSLLSLYDVGTLGDHGFLCMELVEGCDLQSHLRTSDASDFDMTSVARVIALLAGALSVLHGRFLVHRDVKPSNVRLRADGTPVLLDYGLLTHVAHADASETGVGTPAYMSPEQMEGKQVGPASDLYSLGVMLHELLTGRLPPSSARWNESRDTTDPPLEERPGIPAQVTDLCRRLLSAKSENRPVPRQIVAALGLDEMHAGISLAPPLSFPRTFVARDAQLLQMDRAFAQAEAQGHCVRIEGKPQSGKSALLDHAIERMRARSPETLLLRESFTTSRSTPYGAIDEVARAVAEHLVRHPQALTGLAVERAAWAREVFPALGSVSALALAHSGARVPDLRERRSRAFAFVSDLLGHLARTKPVIVALDDVDAAPRDALQLLEVLTRRAQPGLFWIATSLPNTAQSSNTVWQNIRLPALSTAELATLAAQAFQHACVTPSSQNELPPLSGSPTTLLTLVADRLLGGRAQTLDDAYLARISSLTPEALEMLQFLCAVDLEPTREELFLASPLSAESRVESLMRLRSAALVCERQHDDGRRPLHVASKRLRELVEGQLSSEARVALARAWARAFAGQGPHTAYERYLCHQRAGDVELAADSARMLAGRADAALGFGRAAELKQQLVSLPRGTSHEVGRGDFRALGDTLVLDGRPLEAADAYLRAAQAANSAERLDLNRRRATLLLRSGEVTAGTDAIKDVLESLGLSLPSTSKRALFSLLWWRTKLAFRGLKFQAKATTMVSQLDLMRIDALLSMANVLGLVDAFRGSELQTRALFMALRAGESRHLARALVQEANASATFEPPPLKKTNALLATAEQLLAHTDDAYSRALLTMTRGLIAFYEFRPHDARTLLEQAEQLFCDECSDVEWELGNARQFLLQTLQFQEAYAELRVRTQEHLREAEARGDHYVVTNLTMLGASFVHLLDSDPEAALQGVERVMPVWNATGEFYLQHFFELLARTSIASHAHSRAGLDFLRAAQARLERSLLLKSPLVRNTMDFSLSQAILSTVAHVAIEPTERDSLLKECAAIAKRLGKERYPMMALVATTIDASIAFARGELEVALSVADRAIAEGQSLGIPGQQWRYTIACVRGDSEQARILADEMRRAGVRDPHRFSFAQVPTALPYSRLDPV